MYLENKTKVYSLGRLVCAEDGGAIHLSDSVSHKRFLSLEARGSSGALSLQVGEDGHHVSGLHVLRTVEKKLFNQHTTRNKCFK